VGGGGNGGISRCCLDMADGNTGMRRKEALCSFGERDESDRRERKGKAGSKHAKSGRGRPGGGKGKVIRKSN